MTRAAILAFLPWAFALAIAVIALAWLTRAAQARWKWSRLRDLHRDQTGAVQSLAFVLTLPLFMSLLLLIVQVSQIMVGTIVVHYAAFASARSASVWIPANTGAPGERENSILTLRSGESSRNGLAGATLSPKFDKIESAAILACVPISPSADGQTDRLENPPLLATLERVYRAMAPDALGSARLSRRLRNKLAYSRENTWIEISIHHDAEDDPPLQWYDIGDDYNDYSVPTPATRGVPRNDDLIYRDEYGNHEIGWQDAITVKVTHRFSLLPGPCRLFARRVVAPSGSVRYSFPITATATLGAEGEKSVLPYRHAVTP